MKKLLVIFTAALMLLSLAACTNTNVAVNTDPEVTTTNAPVTTEAPAAAAVSVTVKDSDGNPVQGVMLQICKDTCVPMVTDANGVATFNNMEASSEHKLSVLSCPEGYVYNGEPEMYLVDGLSEYEVELDKQ